MDMSVYEKLYRFPPRYGPEWGSGGIFGLRYHKGVLYFTLAFEAEAHFIRDDREKVYRFEHIGKGPGPRSGGDTYSAVEVVDDKIYFGGWVHAPAIYGGRKDHGGIILFYNKFSHVHVYDILEDEVQLLWKDTIEHEEKWAGEVSEIVYNPVDDRLIIARADGHEHLGIYALDRKSGKEEKLSEDPGLKGSTYLDYVCFDIMRDWSKGVEGIQCMDMVTGKWTKRLIDDYAKISVDGHGTEQPLSGCASSAYARFFMFVKGGVLVGNPVDPSVEPLRFIRLFDFVKSGYSPTRTVALPLGGGILTAFNSFTHGIVHARNPWEKELLKTLNTTVGPTVLVYITPPMARIVGALGARVTSIEKVGDKVLLGTTDTANLMALDASPIDVGHRDILVVSTSALLYSPPPPVSFVIPGSMIGSSAWGGIPLWGYDNPVLIISSTKENTLKVYEYDLLLPACQAEEEQYRIKKGKNAIELEGYHRIVSFKLEKEDPQAKIYIHLS